MARCRGADAGMRPIRARGQEISPGRVAVEVSALLDAREVGERMCERLGISTSWPSCRREYGRCQVQTKSLEDVQVRSTQLVDFVVDMSTFGDYVIDGVGLLQKNRSRC